MNWTTALLLMGAGVSAGADHSDEDLLRVLDLKPGMMVADVGCGTGRISELVAGEVGPDGLVFAVDVQADIVQKVRDRNVPNILAILSMPEDVSLEEESVDLAFMHDVASHVKEDVRPEFYASLTRALRPQGVLVIFGHHSDTHRIFEEVSRYGFRPENAGEYSGLTARELDVRMEQGVRFLYQPSSGEFDPERIAEIVGKPGRFDPAGETLSVAVPREDVAVLQEGNVLDPLTLIASRATFQVLHGTQVELSAQFVLFDDELDTAMDAALDLGLTVTALHDHLLHDEPPTRFMHARGTGGALRLARAFRSVIDGVAAFRAAGTRDGAGAWPSVETGVPDQAALEQVLGFELPSHGSGLSFELAGRDHGMMSRATFTGNDQRALVEGRFACTEKRLRRVLKALRAGAFHVWAVHPPQSESDSVTFVHYRSIGRARDLASTVRDGLEALRLVERQ